MLRVVLAVFGVALSSVANATGTAPPIPPETANELFAYALGGVVLFWATGLGVGVVLSLLREKH